MRNNFFVRLIGLLILVLIFLVPAQALAHDLDVGDLFPFGWWGGDTGLVACDGEVCTSLCQLLDLIQHIIYFGLSLLIFAITPIMLLLGGGMIMMSRGEEMLSKGKKIVTSTVVGLLIGLSAFVIISTFLWLIGNNTRESGESRVSWPDIECQVSAFSILPKPEVSPNATTTPAATTTQPIQECPSCTVIGGGQIVFKPGVGNQVAEMMADAMYCFDDATNLEIRITEAYPPTYLEHDSPQHYNGCAVDFTINLTPVAFIYSNTIRPEAESCGLVARNEYTNPSPGATGNHIHLQLPAGDCP